MSELVSTLGLILVCLLIMLGFGLFCALVGWFVGVAEYLKSDTGLEAAGQDVDLTEVK